MRPEVLAGRYEIEREVASGGMGTIFRARDREHGTPVAIKLLHHVGDAGRFAREVELLRQLSHPGIVRYIAHGETADGTHYLVMEWVEGVTLAASLEQDGFTVGEAVTVVRRIADALAEVHRQGLVHRDIKPTNIIFVGGRIAMPKLLDFGIARRAHEAHGLTRTGVMIGTPGYMAPEQARGRRDVDARADVFALGCLLYECLSGSEAFAGLSLMAVRAKIILDEPPALEALCPEAPAELAALVTQLLAKEPGERPPDAAAVAARLARLGELAGGTRRRTRAVRATPTRRVDRTDEGLLFLVMAASGDAEPEHGDTIAEPVAALAAAQNRERELCEAAAAFGGRLELLADGSVVVTLAHVGVPSEQAAWAARCALALRALLPEHPMALALEDRTASGALGLGAAIERGVQTLMVETFDKIFADEQDGSGGQGAIRLDDRTVELLADRFDVVRGAQGSYLRGEKLGIP